jgi:hypothetical protein
VIPQDCPRYEKCTANVCPLDPDMHKRSHMVGEPVCFWLREWSKAGGPARVTHRLRDNQAQVVADTYESFILGGVPIPHGSGAMRRALEDSARGSSKLAAGEALKRAT